MKWKNDYLTALDKAKLFQDTGHRTRFKELMDCYAGFPFFSKGLCKCIYLSAWDEGHFAIMLETLNEMTLAFLEERPFRLEEGVVLEPAYQYILDQALLASDVIDQVKMPEQA